jgi:uncharacterized RDD family membrane protein YckC
MYPRQARGPDPYVLPARVGAFIIDGFAIAFLAAILSRYFVVLHVGIPHPQKLADNLSVDYDVHARSLLWGIGLSGVVFFLYFLLFEVVTGTTPGKALAGLRIVDLQGWPASRPALLARNLLRPIDALGSYWLGFLVARFSQRRQRIGDKAAGTLVVSARSVAATAPPGSHRLRSALVALGLTVMLVAGTASLSYLIPPPLVLNGAASGGGTTVGELTVSAPGVRSIRRVTVQRLEWAAGKESYRLGFLVAAGRPARTAPCHITLFFRWTGLIEGWEQRGFDEACLGRTASDIPSHPGSPPRTPR